MSEYITYERVVGYTLAALSAMSLVNGDYLVSVMAFIAAFLVYTRPVVEEYGSN